MIDASRDDYDTPWKEIVTHAFPEFMAFYFPAAATEIDCSAAPGSAGLTGPEGVDKRVTHQRHTASRS